MISHRNINVSCVCRTTADAIVTWFAAAQAQLACKQFGSRFICAYRTPCSDLICCKHRHQEDCIGTLPHWDLFLIMMYQAVRENHIQPSPFEPFEWCLKMIVATVGGGSKTSRHGGFPGAIFPRAIELFYRNWTSHARLFAACYRSFDLFEVRWMEEILHQLVDGLSPHNPIIYSAS